jgi:hypothetical protein
MLPQLLELYKNFYWQPEDIFQTWFFGYLLISDVLPIIGANWDEESSGEVISSASRALFCTFIGSSYLKYVSERIGIKFTSKKLIFPDPCIQIAIVVKCSCKLPVYLT